MMFANPASFIRSLFDGVPYEWVLWSGGFVLLALVMGLVLRVPRIRTRWDNLGWRALGITAVALGAMFLFSHLATQKALADPVFQQKMMELSAPPPKLRPNETMVSRAEVRLIVVTPWTATFCAFLAIFSIVNFPRKREHGLPPH